MLKKSKSKSQPRASTPRVRLRYIDPEPNPLRAWADGEVRFVMYIRASGLTEDLLDSIDKQFAEGRAYGEANGWRYHDNYVDLGSVLSKRRPALENLRTEAQCRGKPFDFVVVHSMDRLFRDPFELALFEQALSKSDIAVHSVVGSVVIPITGMADAVTNFVETASSLRAGPAPTPPEDSE